MIYQNPVFLTPAIAFALQSSSAEVKKKNILISSCTFAACIFTDHFYSRLEMDQSQGRLVNFRLLYLITQLIGIAIVILIASWIGLHLNGFSWDYENPKVLFNFHPIFMTIGMVFLYGNCKLTFETNLSEGN